MDRRDFLKQLARFSIVASSTSLLGLWGCPKAYTDGYEDYTDYADYSNAYHDG